jgi:transcriptional regulator with XRE-family HTH domain
VPRRIKPENRHPVAIAFGSAVREIREGRGETLEDVAGRISKLDPRYLGEVELGFHVPTIITAKKIADALETTLARLLRDL